MFDQMILQNSLFMIDKLSLLSLSEGKLKWNIYTKRICESEHPIVFDTETTGFDRKNDDILEIAAYSPSTGNIFQALIRPPRKFMTNVVNNITQDMVKNEESFNNVYLDFENFLLEENCDLLIAHNAFFDFDFIQKNLIRNNMISLFFNGDYKENKNIADTQIILQKKFQSPNQKLGDIYKINENQMITKPSHRALDDCYALGELLFIVCYK